MTEIGEIPSEWKVKKLGEITIGKGEYGIGASATEYIEGNIFKISNVINNKSVSSSCRWLVISAGNISTGILVPIAS